MIAPEQITLAENLSSQFGDVEGGVCRMLIAHLREALGIVVEGDAQTFRIKAEKDGTFYPWGDSGQWKRMRHTDVVERQADGRFKCLTCPNSNYVHLGGSAPLDFAIAIPEEDLEALP